MLITKCDICKKQIKDTREEVVAGQSWHHFSFCLHCGKPILLFLKKRKLLQEPKSKA